MNRRYGIVILNKYPELAKRLITSIARTHSDLPKIVVVRDGHAEEFGNRIDVIDGIQPFVFARNANLGFNHFKDDDIILCNDDTECIQTDMFHRLSGLCDRHNIGLMSPLIDGGVGNRYQKYPIGYEDLGTAYDYPFFDMKSQTICFPCVYLSRKAINKVGPMNEAYVGYGFDDDDYFLRMLDAGFRTCITPRLVIKHGDGGATNVRGKNWSASFYREAQDMPTNLEIFLKDHPDQAHKFQTSK